MKKVVTLFLCVILVFGVMAPAVLATEDNVAVQPRYFRIGTYSVKLDINSSGKSTCYCKVKSNTSTDSVELTMELQRLKGEDWSTIKTWTGSGTWFATLDKTWYVTSGYEYQLKITAEVYDSTGSLRETQVEYSCSVDY